MKCKDSGRLGPGSSTDAVYEGEGIESISRQERGRVDMALHSAGLVTLRAGATL